MEGETVAQGITTMLLGEHLTNVCHVHDELGSHGHIDTKLVMRHHAGLVAV